MTKIIKRIRPGSMITGTMKILRVENAGKPTEYVLVELTVPPKPKTKTPPRSDRPRNEIRRV